MVIKKENPVAMINYAIMLQYGDGVNIDKCEALRYYKMAAGRGDEFVMTNYAAMLSNGDGVSINK